MSKDLITMQLTRNLDISDPQHFKVISRIMPDNIIPRHIRLLGMPSKFCNILKTSNLRSLSQLIWQCFHVI